jgi:ribosomal protein S18 acetylase RimI-like enzyme
MTFGADDALELTRLRRDQAFALLDMLMAIERNGESQHFSPHPFTSSYIESLCQGKRRDLHYVLTTGSGVVGYGLLRGWDEGFPVPSLGIAIHPAARGMGHASALMHFLHCAARIRNAERVRLRVHEANAAAIALYRRVGYVFEPALDQDGLRVAYKSLRP